MLTPKKKSCSSTVTYTVFHTGSTHSTHVSRHAPAVRAFVDLVYTSTAATPPHAPFIFTAFMAFPRAPQAF